MVNAQQVCPLALMTHSVIRGTRRGIRHGILLIADMESADNGVMLNEMKDIRESLRRFIMEGFSADMRQMARHLEMQIQSNAEVLVTPSDFKTIL